MVQSDKDMTANTEDALLPEQSQKEVVNSQIGEPLFAELHQELKRVRAQDDCPWPPALCGDGGFWGACCMHVGWTNCLHVECMLQAYNMHSTREREKERRN